MPNRPTPPHTAVAYEFCDILDRIAEQNPAGSAWAQTLASAAINSAAAYFPRAAKAVLGDHLIAAHKSAAAKLPARLKAKSPLDAGFEQAQARLRARFGDDEALQRLNRWIDEVAPMGAAPPPATDQSKPTTKAAPPDPFAAALQGDLTSDMIPR